MTNSFGRALQQTCLLLPLLLLSACTTVSPHTGGLLEQTIQETQISSLQLRLYLNEYAKRNDRRIEETADLILAQTSDPEIARHALMWKTYVISANYRATARPDAFAAFKDVWVLSRQVLQFFENGEGSGLFGEFQSIAVDTARELERDFHQIAAKIAPSEQVLQSGEAIIDQVAQSSPLQSLYLVRKSPVIALIESYQPADLGIMDVVGNVSSDIAALQQILVVYGDFLPRQARWQAQLMLMDLRGAEPVARVVDDISEVADALARIASLTDSLSELAERERRILLDAVHRERVDSFDSIEVMREDTLRYISDEVDQIFLSIETERQAIMAQIATERESLSQDIKNQSQGLMLESRELIDHFYKRAYQLTALVFVLALILVIVYARLKPLKPIQSRNMSD